MVPGVPGVPVVPLVPIVPAVPTVPVVPAVPVVPRLPVADPVLVVSEDPTFHNVASVSIEKTKKRNSTPLPL